MSIDFLKIDINILDDEKISIIRDYPDGDKLFVLWIWMLCMAMKSNTAGYIYVADGIPFTTANISKKTGIPEKTVEMGIALFTQYKMVKVIKGGIIEVTNFNKHQKLNKIEAARIASRKSSKLFRERQKRLLITGDCHRDSHVTKSDIVICESVTKSDETDLDLDLDLDLEADKEEDKESVTDISKDKTRPEFKPVIMDSILKKRKLEREKKQEDADDDVW